MSARALLAQLRAMRLELELATGSDHTFTVELSRAYRRRRYMLSYRQFQGGLCVRAGTLILLDLTAPEVWIRPANREPAHQGDQVHAGYLQLVHAGAVAAFMHNCMAQGVALQRFSETPAGLEAWLEQDAA